MIDTIITDIDVLEAKIPDHKEFNIYEDIIADNVVSTRKLIPTLNEDLCFFVETPIDYDTSSIIVFFDKEHQAKSFNYVPSVAFNHVITQKWVFSNDFKSNVLRLQEEGDIDLTLDYVYNTLDDLLLKGKFDLCNSLLDDLDPKDYEISVLIGILTITADWKDKLDFRDTFYQKVSSYIYAKRYSEDAKLILSGLD